jgi:hypothetical protein
VAPGSRILLFQDENLACSPHDLHKKDERALQRGLDSRKQSTRSRPSRDAFLCQAGTDPDIADEVFWLAPDDGNDVG